MDIYMKKVYHIHSSDYTQINFKGTTNIYVTNPLQDSTGEYPHEFGVGKYSLNKA